VATFASVIALAILPWTQAIFPLNFARVRHEVG
jgi:hypothetical protein